MVELMRMAESAATVEVVDGPAIPDQEPPGTHLLLTRRDQAPENPWDMPASSHLLSSMLLRCSCLAIFSGTSLKWNQLFFRIPISPKGPAVRNLVLPVTLYLAATAAPLRA